jgi:hypothetical protein
MTAILLELKHTTLQFTVDQPCLGAVEKNEMKTRRIFNDAIKQMSDNKTYSMSVWKLGEVGLKAGGLCNRLQGCSLPI